MLDDHADLTPLLEREVDSELWLIGLGAGKQRLGGSVLAQVFAPIVAVPFVMHAGWPWPVPTTRSPPG